MGIVEDLDATKPTISNQCGVALAKKAHPDVADEIETVCRRKDRSARIIADVLARHDIAVTTSAILRHRRGDCRCGR